MDEDVKQYPKWKYHEDFEPVVVKDEEEELSLGDGWVDSPAEYGEITAPSAEQMKQPKPIKKKR